jgi:hypothetical protein
MPQGNRQNTPRGNVDRPGTQPGRAASAPTPAAREQDAGNGGRPQAGTTARPAAMMGEVRDRIQTFGNSAGETVGEHPMVSMLALFGIGFGVGFAMARLLAPEEETWSSRARDSFNDAFRELSHTLRGLPHATAEGIASAFRR